MSTLAEIESAVERLPAAEQEELLNRLAIKLGSVGTNAFPAREDHVRLLDERFAVYRANPAQASTWAEVKRRFESHRG